MSFDNGTPQGSLLSPYLFNTLMEELVFLPLGSNTKLISYADDIAIVTKGPHHLQKAQNAIAAVFEKYSALGLKINLTKTKAKQTPTPAQDTAKQHRVDTLPSVPGDLDRRQAQFPTTRPHNSERTFQNRVRHRLKVLRAITAIEGGADFQVLKTFYLQGIRSIIDYAATILATIPPSQIEHLAKRGSSDDNGGTMMDKTLQPEGRDCNRTNSLSCPRDEHNSPGQESLTRKSTITRVHQSFAQNEDLFRKKTWAHKAAQGIKSLKLGALFLTRATDAPHPDYTEKKLHGRLPATASHL
ncbi:hypothetical protein E2C01_071469 [Portunus trituberculatus]|uniref:Reverse transcriptase domain-containing protein n=1 Tax=Portunus trituberculatus TaxID=210409 RepID=A0A5B7HX37_PORTR|nr:hypothetical protein [Portunus trituberculatus]